MVNSEMRVIILFVAKVEKLYTASKNKIWLWLRSWAPTAQLRLKFKVRKTTRLYKYELNQIPYCQRAQVLGALLYASNSQWSSIQHIVMYMFQCYTLKSSCPCLPLSPQVYFLHLSPLTRTSKAKTSKWDWIKLKKLLNSHQ